MPEENLDAEEPQVLKELAQRLASRGNVNLTADQIYKLLIETNFQPTPDIKRDTGRVYWLITRDTAKDSRNRGDKAYKTRNSGPGKRSRRYRFINKGIIPNDEES